jgi:FtsH-binding integral membrane protein
MYDTRSAPLVLSKSTESQVYSLFAVAMALTVAGTWLGVQFAPTLLVGGYQILFLIAELALIFTSGFWINRSPLNLVLFGLFPLLSGLTFAPYALHLLTGYANGGAILLNATAATTFMALAAAVAARTTNLNTSSWGMPLVLGLVGLLVLSLLQVFIPAFRTTQFDLLLSGAGIVLFSLFLTYDLQRIQQMGRMGANPLSLALSLYLDIFNLFLYVLRFMTALSGDRR